MRTARLLPVSPWSGEGGVPCLGGGGGGVYLVPGGVPDLGDVPGLGGVPGLGVYLVRGCTWSQGGVPGPEGCTWSQGVNLVWGVYLVWVRWVYLVQGVYLVRGCTWSWGCIWSGGWGVPCPGGDCSCPGTLPSPMNRMIDMCKNITLPQTSFAGGNKEIINDNGRNDPRSMSFWCRIFSDTPFTPPESSNASSSSSQTTGTLFVMI